MFGGGQGNGLFEPDDFSRIFTFYQPCSLFASTPSWLPPLFLRRVYFMY